jgi:hypothetical protein
MIITWKESKTECETICQKIGKLITLRDKTSGALKACLKRYVENNEFNHETLYAFWKMFQWTLTVIVRLLVY